MQKVRVWNDNVVEHVEQYKGETIRIPAGGSIEMDRDEAVQFKSQFRTPVKNQFKVQTAESKKILRIEAGVNGVLQAKPETQAHICMRCGFKAQNKAGLASHMRTSSCKDSLVGEEAKAE